jgi:hypothetical protein
MPGLVPGIQPTCQCFGRLQRLLDGRAKPGHGYKKSIGAAKSRF